MTLELEGTGCVIKYITQCICTSADALVDERKVKMAKLNIPQMST